MSRSDNGIFPFPIGIPFRAARLKNDRGIVSHKAFAVRLPDAPLLLFFSFDIQAKCVCMKYCDKFSAIVNSLLFGFVHFKWFDACSQSVMKNWIVQSKGNPLLVDTSHNHTQSNNLQEANLFRIRLLLWMRSASLVRFCEFLNVRWNCIGLSGPGAAAKAMEKSAL